MRELENFIERSVILTHGSVLAAPLNELTSSSVGHELIGTSWAGAERADILKSLKG
jgi:hypothetical protein